MFWFDIYSMVLVFDYFSVEVKRLTKIFKTPRRHSIVKAINKNHYIKHFYVYYSVLKYECSIIHHNLWDKNINSSFGHKDFIYIHFYL